MLLPSKSEERKEGKKSPVKSPPRAEGDNKGSEGDGHEGCNRGNMKREEDEQVHSFFMITTFHQLLLLSFFRGDFFALRKMPESKSTVNLPNNITLSSINANS